MPLQQDDPLPLVQEGGLPVHLIRHPPLPWLVELPTLRRGKPQLVILIGLTTSRRHMELISPKWELGQRTHRRFWLPSGCFIGDTPCPIGVAPEENQMEKVPPTNVTHPITSVFLHIWTRWPLLSANLEPYKTSTKDAELYELKVKELEVKS